MKKPSNNLVASIKKGIRGTFTFTGKSNQFEFTTYIILTAIVFYGSKILTLFVLSYDFPLFLDEFRSIF